SASRGERKPRWHRSPVSHLAETCAGAGHYADFMRVIIVESAIEVANLAAERIAAVVRTRRAAGKAAVLGVATGSSPLGTYAALAEIVRAEAIDLTGVSAFALDEYVGLSRDHPESYYASIRRTVTEPLGLDPALLHV